MINEIINGVLQTINFFGIVHFQKLIEVRKVRKKLIGEVVLFHKDLRISFFEGYLNRLLKKRFRMDIPVHVIRKTMKDNLNMSFKRVNKDYLNFTISSTIIERLYLQ